MKGASGGAPFRSRVPQPEAPPTGSRDHAPVELERGGGNTDGDDAVSLVGRAGAARNSAE